MLREEMITSQQLKLKTAKNKKIAIEKRKDLFEAGEPSDKYNIYV